jgi:iron complex transport system substrate-binding protein
MRVRIDLMAILMLSISLLLASGNAYDFTLGIYGNANMDSTIDQKDIDYAHAIINGSEKATKLADANNDGKIDDKDVTQIEQIINKTERKLIFVDIFGDPETVNKPIKRLANIGFYSIEITRALDAMDILLPIIGYDRSKQPVLYPEFSKWPVVGYTPDNCDFEKVLAMKPDAVMTNLEAAWTLPSGKKDKTTFESKFTGIPIICLNMREINSLPENVIKYGYIIDREDESKKFIDWFEGYLDEFKNLTKGLSKDQRPSVYYEGGQPYRTKNSSDRYAQAIMLAGGRNIADEMPNSQVMFDISPESVVKQNPQFIIICAPSWDVTASYETDDNYNLIKYRNEIMNRSELANVDAIKNKRVYVLDGNIYEGAGRNVIGIAYLGRLFHPDLFRDVDPEEIQQEYTENIWHINFDVRRHGSFVYPPYNTWAA